MNKLMRVVAAATFLLPSTVNWEVVHGQAKDPIQSIRQQYAAINKRTGRYKKVKKELSGLSLEGGELIAYLNGPVIVKLTARHYGEGGNTVEEYYYSNGNLIFVYEKVSHYDRPMTGKVVRVRENRFYFHDGKLIRWIDEKGKIVKEANEGFQLKGKELLENSAQFVTGARSSSPSIEARE
jgi:hypothetical protein